MRKVPGLRLSPLSSDQPLPEAGEPQTAKCRASLHFWASSRGQVISFSSSLCSDKPDTAWGRNAHFPRSRALKPQAGCARGALPGHTPQQALRSGARVSTWEGPEVTTAQTSLLSQHPLHPPWTCGDHRKEPGHRFPVPLPVSAPGGPGGLAASVGPRPECGEAQTGPVARRPLPAIPSHLAPGGAP